MNSRIEIMIKDKEIVEGRWIDTEKTYYKCWCKTLELFGKELYEAIHVKYENVLVFKVRYCNKIKAMRKTDKSKYTVIHESVKYEIFQIDFKSNSKDWVFIKAKMVV